MLLSKDGRAGTILYIPDTSGASADGLRATRGLLRHTAGQGGSEVPERKTGLTDMRAMKSFLLKLFTWWNSQTFGTQFWTWKYGEAVGSD
jgi:hypothetical protein